MNETIGMPTSLDPQCLNNFADSFHGDGGIEVTKISKKGVETLQEIVTEFILFVTSEACERAKAEKRGTIQDVDILGALQNLGFDSYHHEINLYN